AQLVARRGVQAGLLVRSQLLGQRSQVPALDLHPTGLRALHRQPALVSPAPHRVITDPEQSGGLTDPELRHSEHAIAASAARTRLSSLSGKVRAMPVQRVMPTDESADLIDLVRDIAREALLPHVDEAEAAARFPREVFATLGRAG